MNKRTAMRKQVRKKRNQLSLAEQSYASSQLLAQLSQHPKIRRASHIALYLANDGELDTNAFIQWCWQQRKQVYLPVLHPFCKGYLLFLRYQPDTSMVKNKFGIAEPKLNVNDICPIADLDIVFTPLVAFDASGARLGMGGGFYDRTLANRQDNKQSSDFPDSIKPYPIALAHDCQQVDKIPSEIWDIPLPEIITPSQQFISK